jgi:hypothetical protein
MPPATVILSQGTRNAVKRTAGLDCGHGLVVASFTCTYNDRGPSAQYADGRS